MKENLQTTSQIIPYPKRKKLFSKEFHVLYHILENSQKFLLVAHSYPDSDTLGSNVALYHFLKNAHKEVLISCTHKTPDELTHLSPNISLIHPEEINISYYDVIIACDSVDRGYSKYIHPYVNTEKQITILIDHHPDIHTQGDVTLIDPTASSVCEILSTFFSTKKIEITSEMATALLSGILGDTGSLQHTNTTKHVLKITSELLRKGAYLGKISANMYANKNLDTLRLWGKALENATVYENAKMILSGITHNELSECNAKAEDISHIANMLATVPGIQFSLILAQYDENTIKGSFRAEPEMNDSIDLSLLARKLGGGGHRLASGFTLNGKLIRTETGWLVE